MIENRFIHINEKETFEETKPNIQDSSIVFCKESGEIVTHGENYGDPKWEELGVPKNTIQFIFDQTGTGDVITPIFDTGLLDYLAENIKCYQGKYQKDGSMLVTPLNTTIATTEGPKYYFAPTSYLDGSEISMADDRTNNKDYFTRIPTIYYKSEEIEPDKFKITFSACELKGYHKIFGWDTLIGTGSGSIFNNRFYANDAAQNNQITLSQAKEYLANRGEGYYGMTSDEMGVLMFLNIYHDRSVNKTVTEFNCFLGVKCVFKNGSRGRMCPPNIEIDNALAKITHLDGNIEYLKVPYIWSARFSKLWIGEYLTILPKEGGNGIYNSDTCWMGNSEGVAMYCACDVHSGWQISADRNDARMAQDVSIHLKIRPCFKGKIMETDDVDYFKSLPIIN